MRFLKFSILLVALCNAPVTHTQTTENQKALIQTVQATPSTTPQPEKEWTFMVYIAADNDLNRFSMRNLEDMAKVGSNKNLNIVAHLDRLGIAEKTKRLYVEKDNLVQVNYGHPSSLQKLDSGCETTLIEFCEWAIQTYPAKHYALVLWNHGSGIIDNVAAKLINPSELFVFNPRTNMLDLDRTVSFFDFAAKHQKPTDPRGVCFSDTYNTFLTNQKLDFALKTVKEGALKGKNFDIIGYDACLMAMVEVADLLAPYADFAVFSEEVELGAGWKYDEVLKPFLYRALTPEQFATHIVIAYDIAYQNVTQDYTFSAISLSRFTRLERSLDQVSGTLLDLLKNQQGTSVLNFIRAARSRNYCTHFAQPIYIDLDHFLANIADTITHALVTPDKEYLKSVLRAQIAIARFDLAHCVLAHVEGKKLARARGLAVYYPNRLADSSYAITPFAQKNRWMDLISAAI